jgi:hypothetical protein
MNASFDNLSLIRNILILKDRQEESSIKEKTHTHTHNKPNQILLMGFKIISISKQTKLKQQNLTFKNNLTKNKTRRTSHKERGSK